MTVAVSVGRIVGPLDGGLVRINPEGAAGATVAAFLIGLVGAPVGSGVLGAAVQSSKQ